MNCKITISPSGTLEKVLDFNGVESQLFKQIASLPYIQNVGEALDIYLKTQDEAFQKSVENSTDKYSIAEPILRFQLGNGQVVNSYFEVLSQGAGEIINAGFPVDGEFIPLHSFSSEISPNTLEGKINNLILNNTLSPVREKIGTEYRLQGFGDNLTTISFNNVEALGQLNQSENRFIIQNNTLVDKLADNFLPYESQVSASAYVEDFLVDSNQSNLTAAQQDKVDEYISRLAQIKSSDPDNYWSVDLPSEQTVIDAARNGRLIEVEGGMAVVTDSGNLVGVFKDGDGKGLFKEIAKLSIDAGAFKLDNYDTYLTGIYEKNGFRVVSRLEFNEDYAPEGWNQEKHGTPDVVFMVYDPEGKISIDEQSFTKNQYEEASAYRDSYTEQVLAIHPFYMSNPLLGTGASTQEFFGNVVTGGDARYEPSKSYQYEEIFTGEKEKFRENYDSKKGNFDEHIATSIPTFRETQVKKGAAIVAMLSGVENPVVYDLGGSEGSWIKTITEESNGQIKTINLDPSPDMQASFNRNKPENSEMAIEAFYQGWDDIPTHVPTEKADVVHESMMFQFIDNNGERRDYVNEVADNYLKEDGIFITEEKFKMPTEEEYRKNEALKEPHKNKYYTKEQQSLKSDQVLVGMKENQASFTQYLSDLRSRFDFVVPYWSSGNFRGIVASNNQAKVQQFLSELGGTSNEYTYQGNNDYPIHNEEHQTVILNNDNKFQVVENNEALNYINTQTGVNIALDRAIDALIDNEFDANSVVDTSKILNSKEKYDIQNKLLGILEGLGVKVTSLSGYLKNYKQKFGIDPSVEALSDLTQRVVALAEGGNTLENLSEEVSHFLVEAYNSQDEINALLPEVENSPEWAEESAHYFNLYEGQGLTGENLTDKVRREILGKIVSNSILSRADSSLYTRALNLIDNFINTIKGFFSSNYRANLDSLVNRITESALEEDKFNNNFSVGTLNQSNFDIFYSAKPSTLSTNLNAGATLMQKQLAVLQREGTGRGLQMRMDTLRNQIEAADVLKSVSTYLDMVDTIYSDVNRKVKKATELERKGQKVSPILMGPQAVSADILVTENLAHLSTLRDNLLNYTFEEQSDKKTALGLIDKITAYSSDIQNLSGELKNLTTQRGEEMVENLMQEFRLPEDVRDAFRLQLDSKLHDINMLMANFGNMQNSSNPILLILSKMINRMYTTVRNQDLKVYNALAAKLKDLGMIDKLDSFIQKSPEGNLTNYFASVVDYARFDAAFETEKIRLYNEALQVDPATAGLAPIEKLSDIGTKDYPNKMDLSDDARRFYTERETQWLEDNTETPYNGSFKKLREDMFKAIENGVTLADGTTIAMEIPEVVKQQMAEWARRRREIKEPYNINGVVDYTQMSETERQQLNTIKKERKESSSLIDPLTLDEKTGTELDIARAYQAMNAYYMEQSKGQAKRTISGSFFNVLNDFTNGKAGAQLSEANRTAFEFFNKNSGLAFNENFWNDVKTNNLKASQKVENYIATNNIVGDEADNMLFQATTLEKLLSNRSSFLKQFSNPANPAEIDVESMSSAMLTSFKELEQDIESLYSELNTKMESEGGLAPLVETESTANEAYGKAFEEALKLQPSMTEMEFMMGHMTALNKNKVTLFNSYYRDYKRTGIIPITGNFKFVTTKLLGLDPKATNSEIQRALTEYENRGGEALDARFAKSKLLGYFKRYAPKGFGEFYDMLKSGNITDSKGNDVSLSDVIEDIEAGRNGGTSKFEFLNKEGQPIKLTKYLSINAEVEWMEDQNPFTNNPNYVRNTNTSQHMGGSRQPSLDKYRNDDFISKYNIDTAAYTETGRLKSNGTSRELLNELEAINLIADTTFEALKKQGLHNTENSFKRSQVRKTTLEKAGAVTQGNVLTTAKNALRDSWGNTVDKMLYGETVSGDINADGRELSNLTVPVLNVRNLENLDDVTEDVLFGLMTHTHNANLYNERQKVLAKSNQLEQLMLNKQKFIGKEAKNSRAYKWFQDYRRVNLLGVSELNKVEVPMFGRTVNLTNFLRSFDSYQGLVNVGFNPAVSITSGTSAFTFSLTESLLGDFITTDSYKWGSKRFMANQTAFISETGKVDKTSEVYLLGEKFGLFNLTERLNGSKYNQALRTLFKDGLHGAAHTMTEMMTHPYAPTSMYGVLHDFRYVQRADGSMQLMNFSDFKRLSHNQFNTQKELSDAWKALEDNSIIKNVSTENGVITYSDKFKGFWDTMYAGDEKGIADEIEYMENEITSGTENLVSKIDAKMPMYDKSTASRNALLRFALRHREWFSINLQNRWKSQHYNLNTHKYEEGSYISLSTYLKDIFRAFEFKKGASNYKEFKNIYDDLDSHQQKNLQRVLIDVAISALLIAVGGMIIAPIVDDEENKDNWAVQYAGYMYFRLASEQMSVGLSGLPQSKDVIEAPFVAVNSMKEILKPSNYSFDEVERGAYEGHSKLFKLIAKQTFARHYFDTAHGVTQKSDFFRLNNEWTLWGMDKQSKKEKEEQAKYEEDLAKTFSGPDRAGMR